MSCIFKYIGALFLGMTLQSCSDDNIYTKVADHPKTFCNPVNLDYRFMKIKGGAGIREAADPVVIEFKGKYYLFASKSSGYWSTTDFVNWNHIIIEEPVLPIEDYAPAVFVNNDSIYFVASTLGRATLYRSFDPESKKWDKVRDIRSYWDPAFYVEDEKLYLYYGCSPVNPIYGKVLNLQTLEEESKTFELLNSDINNHGWERTGERNELPRRPYIEGAWITKHNGLYYLQYAGPGTEWKTYADGVYVGRSPLGPFKYSPNSPVSYKPTGFIGGAGHGCLFTVGENFWKAATNAISVRHMFERRISFYPAGFTFSGLMYIDTYLGDYPLYIPTSDKGKPVRPDWMLLSYKKKVKTSSVYADSNPSNLVDEEARTAWVAESNTQDEWVEIDLGIKATVNSIQINYDEYGAKQQGYHDGLYQSYVLYASNDGKEWTIIADKRLKRTDTPHDYVEFEIPFKARYIKWQNEEYNISENVSLREIRVFGKADGMCPDKVSEFLVYRNPDDPCRMKVKWCPVKGATGYIIRTGINKDCMYHTYQVTDSTHYELNGLNSGIGYYMTIDSYNECGITKGDIINIKDK